ncbi:MAG: hydrogenase formation protein HypD [Deltaproteobacteria bacterium]|nr:hydrogenase formation protein HypD [Deltaproteobacteria bacterium]
MDLRQQISKLSEDIKGLAAGHPLMNFMEVCGTHTMSIAKHGIRSLLPDNVRIISGPGCPVCVSTTSDIQNSIELAQRGITVATFGDMLKVPGVETSLSSVPEILMIYSPLQAVQYALEHADKEVVLLGIGFETTAPLMAAALLKAKSLNLKNFSLYSMHRIVPPALSLLLEIPDSSIAGFILPGHVSVITGSDYYEFMKKYNTRGVIAGFEALDIMEALYLLVKSTVEGMTIIQNNYPGVVSAKGNIKAQKISESVFENCDSVWRGIGSIKNSGLKIKDTFSTYNATLKFNITEQHLPDPPGCLCGSILLGKNIPTDCGHFGNTCTPANPVGPCMVSSEGTCAAYFKYNVIQPTDGRSK